MAGPEHIKKKSAPVPQDVGTDGADTEQTLEDEEVVTGDDGIFGIPACSKSKLKSFSDVFLCSKTIIDLGFEIKKVHGKVKETPLPDLTRMVLPTKYAPQAATYQTIESIPVCDMGKGPPTDKRFFSHVQRVWYVKDGSREEVDFARPGEVERLRLKYPSVKSDVIITPPNDDVILKIQADKNILRVEDAEEIPGQNEKVVFYVQHYLCRSNAKEPAIWAYAQGPWLKNYCSSNSSFSKKPLMTNFSDYEMMQMISGNLGKENFCINHDNGHLSIINDADTALALIDKTKQSPELTDKQKAKIEDVLKTAFELSIKQGEAIARSSEDSLWNKVFIAVIVGQVLHQTYINKKQMERITGKKKPILPKLRDLTAEAKAGKLSPVSPRLNNAIELLSIHLGKSRLANPVLTSENGVGKTAAVEGLAQAIVKGVLPSGDPLPENLRGKRIVEVIPKRDLEATEGGEYRTIVEQHFKRFIVEVKEAGNVIPFFDEVHTLIGIGRAEGVGFGAEQILKAETARSAEFQFIGATTEEEYDESIALDKPLAGRMPQIVLDIPTAKEAIEDLRWSREYYENMYGRKIPDSTIKEVVRLSEPPTNTNYPRKAFDLLEAVNKRLNVKKNPTDTILPEHVVDFVTLQNASALNVVVDHVMSAIEAAENGLSEEEILKIQFESIEKFLQKRVNNFDGFSIEKGQKVAAIVQMAWKNANPQIKASFTTPSASRYAIPEGFTNLILERIKDSQKIELIPEQKQAVQMTGKGTVEKNGPKGPNGPEDGPPPAANAGAGESAPVNGEVAAAKSEEGESEKVAKRIVLEPEPSRNTDILETYGGFAALAAVLAAKDLAKYFGLITDSQDKLTDTEMLVMGFIADAAFAAQMLGGTPGAIGGHFLGTKGADLVGKAAGIKALQEGGWGNMISGDVTGLAGFAASLAVLGKSEVWQNFETMTATGTRKLMSNLSSTIGSGGMSIEEELSTQWQTVQVGMRIFGSQVGSAASQATSWGSAALSNMAAIAGRTLADPRGYLAIPAGTAIAAGAKAILPTIIEAAATAAAWTGAAAAGAAMGAGIYYSGFGKYIGTDRVADWVDKKLGAKEADIGLCDWYYNHFLK